MTTTASPSVPRGRSRKSAAAARRWPTILGLALGVDAFFGEATADSTHGYGESLLLLPLEYVVLAILRRRGWSWPVLFVAVAIFVALRLQDVVDPVVVLLAVALAAAIWGTGHGRHRERDFRVQLAGMAGFAAIALTGLAVDPDLGRYLVAAGWFAHGVWDWVHLAKDRVVSRSYAEWCGALDVTVAAGLVVTTLP
jgi:hypothetical protein